MAVGPITLLPSGRLGSEVATNRSDQPVFVDSDGHPVCKHGERAATIQAWLNAERKDHAFARPSSCDCENLDGLMTTRDVPEEDLPKIDTPNLYKLLGLLGHKEIKNNTRPQRFALTTHANAEIWVQPTGTLVCKHGNSKKMLAKIQKAEPTSFRSKKMVMCNCSLSVPRRVGTVFSQPRGARQNLARD
jgi:hypothetical protein